MMKNEAMGKESTLTKSDWKGSSDIQNKKSTCDF